MIVMLSVVVSAFTPVSEAHELEPLFPVIPTDAVAEVLNVWFAHALGLQYVVVDVKVVSREGTALVLVVSALQVSVGKLSVLIS